MLLRYIYYSAKIFYVVEDPHRKQSKPTLKPNLGRSCRLVFSDNFAVSYGPQVDMYILRRYMHMQPYDLHYLRGLLLKPFRLKPAIFNINSVEGFATVPRGYMPAKRHV